MHLRSPVDDVAQHLWITGLHHYGKLGHFPRHAALIGDSPTRNIVYCEVWQALTNTGPIHESWKPMVQGTTLFPKRTFPVDAFYVARRLILIVYQMRHASQPVDREKLVKQLLTVKPFLQGITVGSLDASFFQIMADEFLLQLMDKAVVIVDDPLHVVLCVLILGHSQWNGQIPHITEIHVADSIILVCD